MLKIYLINESAQLVVVIGSESKKQQVSYSETGKAVFTSYGDDKLNSETETVFESEIYSRSQNSIEFATEEGNTEYPSKSQCELLFILIENAVNQTP